MSEALDSRFLAARKAYIASQFKSLNNMQIQGVLATEGPLLLLAGAGSGKTTVVINRIANLLRFGRASDSNEIPDDIREAEISFLENLGTELSEIQRKRADYLCGVDPVAPWNILAITFTNKAANELKERLSALPGIDATDIWAMTFHSACCRILRRDIECMGYTKSFTIYDSADSERVMKDVIKELELDDKTFPARYLLGAISREKDKLVDPAAMLEKADHSGDIRAQIVAKAYHRYQKKLKDNNALDFDDIILVTVKMLQAHTTIREYYQRKFKYVMVDEYQDTNHLQYLLTYLLSDGYKNICVVGDDDQSIYRFRGASIDNILNFEKQYTGTRTIRLEQNYRSTQSILNAANAVISHNIGRKRKTLWTDNHAGEPITVYEAADEGAEANYVAGKILSGSIGHHFSDFAILYRTNAQSNALEFALKRNGIPYRVVGGTRFFDRAEVKDMLAYLCVINNRADDLRLLRIINTPTRGLGAKALETAQRMAQAEGAGLYNIISNPYSYAPLEKAAHKFQQFSAMIEGLAELLDNGMSLPEFYEELMIRTGYIDMLNAKDTEENKTRLENIRELKSSILSYVENTQIPTLAGFLEEIALYTDLQEYDQGEDTAVMMTMHSAKGLEFPNVFLVGFEDGLFPGTRAIGEAEEMEEERRLCYVAITRAKENLCICYARQRMIYGRTSAALPSRFLKEIPEAYTVKKGGYRVAETNPYHTSYPSSRMPTRTAGSAMTTSMLQNSQLLLELRQGEMVKHKAFGRGMVLSVQKMGNDALLEIAFDEVGTKKLMSRAASTFMEKLS